MNTRLIIIDRDGVINEDSPDYIKSSREWIPIEGSLEAISRFHHAGWRVIVASNQSGIGRGLFDFDALASIHDKMNRLLAELGGRIDGVFFCPHKPEDNCDCRKPKPGLLLNIAKRLQTDLNNVPYVGDTLRDVQAAKAAGASPVFVTTGQGQEQLEKYTDELGDVPRYGNLKAVADALLGG